MTNKRIVSLVIPAFNEEESIQELIDKIYFEMKTLAFEFEIIFVNDGSTDNTVQIIEENFHKDNRVKLINFRRNFGKSAALSEGFKYAIGDIVITMDADLQDDPSEIKNLIEKIDEGFDLVSGWKKKRNDPFGKTFPSKVFNIMTSRLAGIKLHDFNCGLKAYRKEVTNAFPIYGEMHRFLPVLAYWQGFKIAEVPVQHHARKHGVSKFGARRFLSGIFDLLTVLFITKYKRKPMHIFGLIGLFFFFIGTGIISYLVGLKLLFNEGIGGRPLLLFGILSVIIGIQIIGVGLLGELIINTTPNRREYSIKSALGISLEKND